MLNVVDLGEFKELKELRKSEETYRHYLKTLGNTQLEGEVNYLLDEFAQDSYEKEFFSKGRLILSEISSRAQGGVKTKITLLNEETFRLI